MIQVAIGTKQSVKHIRHIRNPSGNSEIVGPSVGGGRIRHLFGADFTKLIGPPAQHFPRANRRVYRWLPGQLTVDTGRAR